MAVNYMLSREVELAVQEEAAYATSPGAVAGTDMFKHTSRLHITPRRGQYFRDKDTAYQNASVLSVQKGRSGSDVKIDCELIPSGNGTTITAPDIDSLLKAVMGTKHAGTAHTTTAAGSSGTSINFAVGGVAASGVAVGDLIAIDVSAAFGYEVRRVTALPGGDVVTVNAAFSADPAASRTVKLGVTYKLLSTASLSVYLWQWIAGTLARHVVPGVVIQQAQISMDFASQAPVGMVSFSGKGMEEETHSTARPTPSTAGVPLLPAEGKLFNGAALHRIISARLTLNSITDLRENESGSLEATGVKNTNQSSRWNHEQMIKAMLTTGDRDTAAIYDAAKSSDATPFDMIVQLGITPGAIVAWSTPKFVANAVRAEQDGEMAVELTGRPIGTTLDDEVFLAFI